jgi:hypothetical protein
VHPERLSAPPITTPERKITVETTPSIPDKPDNTEPASAPADLPMHALKVEDRVQHDDGRYGTVRAIAYGGEGALVRWDDRTDPITDGQTEWVDTALLTAADERPETTACELVEEHFPDPACLSALPYLVVCPHGEWQGHEPGGALSLASDSHAAQGIATRIVGEGKPRPTATPAEVPIACKVAAELRALADALSKHPELPFGTRYSYAYPRFSCNLATAEQVEEWAAALGIEATDGTSGSTPTREVDRDRTADHPLAIWIYAELPKPDPAEVEKALAFYRKYGSHASYATARCARCGRSIACTAKEPWKDESGSPRCPGSGIMPLHQPQEEHGPRAGEQA